MNTQAALTLLRQIPSQKIKAQLFSLSVKDSAKKGIAATLAAEIVKLAAKSDVVVLVAEIPKAKADAFHQ
ncbi:MAG: hypothetical protein JW384_03387 [Nitrosomonadaceae bacterium]|nr:hypothetical protein [Nitrosomonadaceae bacterium]